MTSTPPPPRRRTGDEDDPTGVRDLLASLPDPGPMPEDLVARISAALEVEARGSGTRSSAGRADRGDGDGLAPVVPLDGATRTHRRGRWAAAALAAAAAAGVVGVAGVNLITRSHTDGTSVSASLGRAGSPAPSTPAPAALPDVQIRLAGAAPADAALAAHGRQMLSAAWSPATPHTVEQPGVGPIGTPDGVLECVAALGLRRTGPVAAEITTFHGRPAIILATHQEGRVVTRVAALPCTRDRAETLASPEPVTP